jgi:nitrate reductase gamma subunit
MGSRLLFGILPYITAGVFFLGILYRFWVWIRTPVPLRIVTTPGPKTRIGVAGRLIGDILWFPNLFKADKLLWAAGWCFHILLWLVLLRHLRYFLYPVPGWVAGIQTLGLYAGYLIPIPIALLLGRRLLMERPLYISILGDYFALFLLLSITLSGLLLNLLFRTYLIDVKALINGLIHFSYSVPEVHWLFVFHFLVVMTLLIYFPFSKLMHGGGLLLSPTRNQKANFEQRFVNLWDFPVSYSDQNLSTPERYRETLTGSKEGEKE